MEALAARVMAGLAGALWLGAYMAQRRTQQGRIWRILGIAAFSITALAVYQWFRGTRAGALSLAIVPAALGLGTGLWVVALSGWSAQHRSVCCTVSGAALLLAALMPSLTCVTAQVEWEWVSMAVVLDCLSVGTLVTAALMLGSPDVSASQPATRYQTLVGLAAGLQVIAALGSGAGLQAATGDVLRRGDSILLLYAPPFVTGAAWLELSYGRMRSAGRLVLMGGVAISTALLSVVGVCLV